MEKAHIGLFVGSLRKESFSKKIANHLNSIAPENFNLEIIEIGQLPFYNQDFDDNSEVPEIISSFRKKVSALDGVLFITPEYNRSVPAVLKNAIDIGSRPQLENVWNEKPGAIISSSIGHISGFGANHHLRQTLTFVNVYTMQQPEAYIAKIGESDFNKEGNLMNEHLQSFIQRFLEGYIKWFEKLKK